MTRKLIIVQNDQRYMLADERIQEHETITIERCRVNHGAWIVAYRHSHKPRVSVWLSHGDHDEDNLYPRLFATPEDAHYYADWWISNRIDDIRIWLALWSGDSDMFIALHKQPDSASTAQLAADRGGLRPLEELWADIEE
jgi:hypothetical protein